MKKDKMRLKGQLGMYMKWPLIMTLLLFAMNIWMYMIDKKAGVMMTVFIAIYLIIASSLYFHNRSLILADLIQFSVQYKGIENRLLKELALPYAIALEDGRILWKNDCFKELMEGQKKEKYLNRLIPDLHPGVFPKDDMEHVEMEVTYRERDYQVELRRVSLQGFSKKEELLQIPEEQEYFVAVSMRDVTELNSYIRENEEQRMIAGLIYIDNYDEVMESVEEVRQSLLVALIDRKINKYIGEVDGIVKKLEKDKYFVVLRKSGYKKIKEDKFSLLEEVKQVNIGNARSATLSIGLGLNTATYALSYQYARVAIDLALARGGDQAVIKDCNGITYFGGKKEQTAKNTRVKARVKAEALREFIVTKDKVIVRRAGKPRTRNAVRTDDGRHDLDFRRQGQARAHQPLLGSQMVPAADPAGDRRRLERVPQLEHVARVLLPQRHYQHAEQGPYEKTRLAGQHAAESAADSRERQSELPEGIPRKARNADRGVRPRNQIAAARADRVGHGHRKAHHVVQARLFLASGRAGQILAREAARLHFLFGKLPQAGE